MTIDKNSGVSFGKMLLIGSIVFMSSMTTFAGLIDASDATDLTGTTEISADHAGYTGDGFLAKNNAADSGFSFVADEDYTSITIRYAAYSAAFGEYELAIIGSDSEEPTYSESMVFDKTGAWSTWTTITLDWSGSIGDTFDFDFAESATNTGGVNVDYVSFDAVPEPATFGLLGFGGLLAVLVRKYKRV